MPTIYLVIFALIFNAVTSTVAFGANNSSDQVLLCTSSGYKWVSVDNLPESKPNAQQHCKLCLFPANDENHDVFAFLSKTPFIASQSTGQFSLSLYPSIKARFAHFIAQGRAPPFYYS